MSDTSATPAIRRVPEFGTSHADMGQTNAQVFEPFADVLDKLEAHDPVDPAPQPTPAEGFTHYEVLMHDLARPNDNGRGQSRLKEFRATLTSRLGISDDDLRIELANLGTEIVARATFEAPVAPEEFLDLLTANNDQSEPIDEALFEVTAPPQLATGTVSFRPGGLGFLPGGLGFLPGTFIPEPVAEPVEVVESARRQRWMDAMRSTIPGVRARRVSVAILDTGVSEEARSRHPLFASSTVDDPFGGSADLEPLPLDRVVDSVYGHGTHVAGIVAQRAPLAGINHESIRRASGVSDAFELALDFRDISDADIVVFSFATVVPKAENVPVMRAVVRQLLLEGKVVVAAAGTTADGIESSGRFPADFRFFPPKSGTDLPEDPLPGILISVGYVDRNGVAPENDRAISDGVVGQFDLCDQAEANRGFDSLAGRPAAHVRSYGVGVASAFPAETVRWGPSGPLMTYQGWARWTGTSMAAPRVAGAIADLYQSNPDVDTVVDAAKWVLLRAANKDGIVD